MIKVSNPSVFFVFSWTVLYIVLFMKFFIQTSPRLPWTTSSLGPALSATTFLTESSICSTVMVLSLIEVVTKGCILRDYRGKHGCILKLSYSKYTWNLPKCYITSAQSWSSLAQFLCKCSIIVNNFFQTFAIIFVLLSIITSSKLDKMTWFIPKNATTFHGEKDENV